MPETEIKTVGLYKVTFEKVAEMSGSEAEAVEAHSDLLDMRQASPERFMLLDEQDDPEGVADLKSKVSPELYALLTELSDNDQTFIIVY